MWIVALPITDSSWHAEGFALNTAARQAFWSVDRREGSAVGSCRSTFAMFACPTPADSIFTSRLAPSALLAWPPAEAVSFGANGRL